MWGNSTGWMISGVIAVAMGFLLGYVTIPPSPTAPTNAKVFAITQQPLTLPVSPDTVVPPGTADADAGVLYRKAIDDYLFATSTYERFKSEPGRFDVKKLTAVPFILRARDAKACVLFRKDPTELVNYENAEPPLDAIFDVGNICCTLGKLYTLETYNKQTRPEEARKLWEAAFVLGQHLYEERVSWLELSDGLGLMSAAGGNLLSYYKEINKDDAKADAIQKFLDGEHDFQNQVLEAIKIVDGIDENIVGQYAGDITAIAVAPKGTPYGNADHMFRVEALKHVGHYRYNSISIGDQRGAMRSIQKVLDQGDADPTVKAAANAARDLTLAKHNAFG